MKIKRNKADAAWSNAIRWRDDWQCQRCGKQYSTGSQALHCHHFYYRRKLTTRWEADNLISVCYGCHSWLHGHPIENVRFMEKKLGKEKLEALEIKANVTGGKVDPKLALLKAMLLLKEEKARKLTPK